MFRIINKKVYEKQKIDLTRCFKKNRDLENELVDLKNKIKTQERIQTNLYKIINKINEGKNITLMKTPKDIDTVVLENFNLKQIEFYDLDAEFLFGRRVLIISWSEQNDKHPKTIYIDSIEGGCRMGHGELALSLLIEWGITNNFTKIWGELSNVDRANEKELIAFYSKKNFKISYYPEDADSHFFGYFELLLT